ncbi:hypothetical protein AB0903_14085 [Streptomyces sp. NPDC048389]|uniref:hypothetical protein n=1 Tax=Streptomyces sp. NPDC048389 TaxID=3154622 RepID=UPI003453DBAD
MRAGLWLKAGWLGRRERADETPLWMRADRMADGAVGKPLKEFRNDRGRRR